MCIPTLLLKEKAQEYRLSQSCENGGSGTVSPSPSGLSVELQKALSMPSRRLRLLDPFSEASTSDPQKREHKNEEK